MSRNGRKRSRETRRFMEVAQKDYHNVLRIYPI